MSMIINSHRFGIVYATMNPADKIGANFILSGGNLTCTRQTGSGASYGACRATIGKTAGKWYFEVLNNADGVTNGDIIAGIMSAADTLSGFPGNTGTNAGSFGWDQTSPNAHRFKNGDLGAVAGYGRAAPGQYMYLAIDLNTGNIWLANSSGSGWAGGGDPSTATSPTLTVTPGSILFPTISFFSPPASCTVNFGQNAFNGVVPTGFNAGWYN